MNVSFSLLSQCLEQEIQWVHVLNKLLNAEKNCLEKRQFKELETIAQQKQELSILLEKSAQKRQPMTESQNATEEFLTQMSLEEQNLVQELNQELKKQLTLCQELNTINGQVIANNLYVHQEIANTLSGHSHQAVNVYNAYGNLKASANSNHHQKA